MDLNSTETEAPPDTAQRIIDTGARLFRHYGYAKTTVADIARELGMSSANIYRFFASKVEIHQAICQQLLAASYRQAMAIAQMQESAEARLRRYALDHHRFTVETMMDEEKVHEMVVVAIERDWNVIEQHIDRINVIVRGIIEDGITAGEFARQDAAVAARCFSASLVILHHPQIAAQCLAKQNRPQPEQIIDFAIHALRK
jgi:AcrR family transcriptional regulator